MKNSCVMHVVDLIGVHTIGMQPAQYKVQGSSLGTIVQLVANWNVHADK